MKRAVDLFGALLLLVVTAPLLTVAAVAILVTMGTPIFYRDTRAGQHGRQFAMLKFRTMRELRQGETVPDSDDARITPVGRILRATSIDELPTFVNVLRGDMSLVGPRPLPVRYVARYKPEEARRL